MNDDKAASMVKTVEAKATPLTQLLRAKEHSDVRQYDAKTAILHTLLRERPDEFTVEEDKDGITGLTHNPTGFRIHITTKAVPPEMRVKSKAAEKVAAPQYGGLSNAATLAGLLGTGVIGGGLYLGSSYKGDPEVSRLDYIKTKLALAINKKRLDMGRQGKIWAIDVPHSRNLHRVVMPRWAIDEKALKYTTPSWEKVLITIPEHGQESFPTWRQYDTGGHLHKHPGAWTEHIDTHQSVTMSARKAKTVKEMIRAIREGVKHIASEGIPGGITYATDKPLETMPSRILTLKERYDLLRGGKPTYGDLLSKMEPLRHGNVVAPATVEKTAFIVEVAETERNNRLGMMYFKTMPDNYGMLFKSAQSFWMPNVNFDLDLAFLTKNGTVTEIQRMHKVRDGEIPRYYTPKSAADYAIEFPAGWCARKGVKPGSCVRIGNAESPAV